MALLEGELNTKGVVTVTNLGLLSRMRKPRDPEATKALERPPEPVPQLPVEAAYPRLRVRYDVETHRALEYAVIEDIRSEIPYMRGWHIRPMSELDEVRRMIECEN
jgi:hypothetical protein